MSDPLLEPVLVIPADAYEAIRMPDAPIEDIDRYVAELHRFLAPGDPQRFTIERIAAHRGKRIARLVVRDVWRRLEFTIYLEEPYSDGWIVRTPRRIETWRSDVFEQLYETVD